MECDRQLQVLIKQERFNLSQRLSNVSQRRSLPSTSTDLPSNSCVPSANNNSLLEKLRDWQMAYSIPRECFDELLNILKSENVTTAGHNDCEEFKIEMRNTIAEMKDMINEKNGEILNIMAENFVYLRQLQPRDVPASTEAPYVYRFPLSTEEELKRLEWDIANGSENEMVETFKKILDPGGIKKNFDKVLADDMIYKYNYSGVKGKMSFKEFTHIDAALYKACLTKGYTKKDYILDLKHAFRLLKNRKNKADFMKRKAANSIKPEMSFNENIM